MLTIVEIMKNKLTFPAGLRKLTQFIVYLHTALSPLCRKRPELRTKSYVHTCCTWKNFLQVCYSSCGSPYFWVWFPVHLGSPPRYPAFPIRRRRELLIRFYKPTWAQSVTVSTCLCTRSRNDHSVINEAIYDMLVVKK